MARATRSSALSIFVPIAALLAGCSSDDGSNPSVKDTGVGTSDTATPDSGTPETPAPDGAGGGTGEVGPDVAPDTNPPPFTLPTFVPPPADPGKGAILFSASGEVLSVAGYPFPPKAADSTAFVDGWELTFTRLIVTLDKITLSENPDKIPTNASATGEVVAQVDGPWAIDLHKGGPIVGKTPGGEQSVAIASVTNKNKAGGGAFDATARYAFGFDAIQATKSAFNVNLDADGIKDYKEMVEKGWAVLYVGKATFKGTACTSPVTTYDFTKLPKTVDFRFGFTTPTSYVNCQNADNDPAKPLAGEEHQRGVQVLPNKSITAQLTMHTDHPFWDSIKHDSPAHFDPIAARFVGFDKATVTLEDLAKVDFSAFKDSKGVNLPWRSCVASFTAKAGVMGFDALTVPVDPSKTPDKALRDFRDYVVYNQSTMGHLNANGLCFVRRRYPSPP